jgi:hypothetical protein
MAAQPLFDRLMRRIEYDTNGGCWLWSGAVITGAGYGNLPVDGKSTAASRVSWTVFRDPIPAGMFVCHRCDVRLCCNPDHLFLGTHRENMADMTRKGRAGAARGESSGVAKLNEAQVREIRASLAAGASQRAVAVKFCVSAGTVQAIAEGRSWRHLEQAA